MKTDPFSLKTIYIFLGIGVLFGTLCLGLPLGHGLQSLDYSTKNSLKETKEQLAYSMQLYLECNEKLVSETTSRNKCEEQKFIAEDKLALCIEISQCQNP